MAHKIVYSKKQDAIIAVKTSKARQKFAPLVEPSLDGKTVQINRKQWLDSVCDSFVSPSTANKEYYRVILEVLWPEGHGIPGLHCEEAQIRDAIDRYRQHKQNKDANYKNYVDVFRRMRELQGEEGLKGITKQGNKYQLISLELSPKRIPRTGLSDLAWDKILTKHDNKCAVCGRCSKDVRLQQDHKIPRVREGGDEDTNWQPLCDECNNFKSTSCRGCNLDCSKCSWAFPEKYKHIRISPEDTMKLSEYAASKKVEPEDLLSEIINYFITRNFNS